MTSSPQAPAAMEPATAPAPVPRPDGAPRRVGLLGTGYIADWHAQALSAVEGVRLAAVCDRVKNRAEAFAQKHGVPAVHDSLQAMLAGERLDAIHILLPPDFHAEAARAVLEAGIHVLLEKPMATRADECDALVALAERRRLSIGVGHNFLFARPYEELRRDVRDGLLGPLDQISITWNRELPQATSGPYDLWMLRDPGNIMLEIGPHSVAHAIDLVGPLDTVQVRPGNPISLPGGRTFFRRWQVDATRGRTAVELKFSFVPGFTEHTIHVRGLLGSATADLEHNTYSLRRPGPRGDDFDRHARVRDVARSLEVQARRTLREYLWSKLRRRPGAPYGLSILRTLQAFYGGLGTGLDERIRGRTGVQVMRTCEHIARSVPGIPQEASAPPGERSQKVSAPPLTLILGSTGFIGTELLRQMVAAGNRTRVLLRSPGKLPDELRTPLVEICTGNLNRDSDLHQALDGIQRVVHLARAQAKTWADYEREEIEVTRRVAEAALAAGVKRFVYTGTIDSYYAGAHAGTITEKTPLDPRIGRRNLYARAKAASEDLLSKMQRDRGLPLVICRPGIVIGRGGSPFHWGVGMWWHGFVCQLWGDGKNKLPFVLVEDVARALLGALETPGLEGESFNLVADPCLSAEEYLDELDRCGALKLLRKPTPILNFYLVDLCKWAVKLLIRHPERRFPSYRDWETRTQQARFDCSHAKTRLGWRPISDRAELVRLGIQEPLGELLR